MKSLMEIKEISAYIYVSRPNDTSISF